MYTSEFPIPPPDAGTAASLDETPISLLERVTAPAGSDEPLPRLLLVLAHPDDEVLAMGARLERLHASRLLTMTDGAPQDGADARHHGFASLEAYREARTHELATALTLAGLRPEVADTHTALTFTPVPDQTAASSLAHLTRVVAAAITEFAPEAILTHPYEGGHPDHDACAFAVQHACALLRARSPEKPVHLPLLIEAPFYHAGADGTLATGSFLPESAVQVLSYKLSAQERVHKQHRLACFATQQETLQQFGTERELFRVAPTYDFTQPPHPGRLFYETFHWGVTGERFRELAQLALEELSLRGTAATVVASPVPGPA